MQPQITTQQMREQIEQAMANRLDCLDKNLPNTGLAPRLIGCDGPRLQLEVAFDTMPWMTNPMGVVHGGMTAVMLDTAMGLTCWSLCGHGTPTISMSINYARPVPLSRTVHVRTQVVVFGRTSSQLTAQLFLPEHPERPLAFATGVYSTKADAEYKSIR